MALLLYSLYLAWQKVASLDCYAGRGGDPIQPDPYSNHMSLNDCKAACNADYNCQGVIRKSSDGQGSGVCYKRRNIVTNNCVRDPVWDLHRKPSGGEFITSVLLNNHNSLQAPPQQPAGPPALPMGVNTGCRAIHATFLTLISIHDSAQQTTT